jgi:hypothetical protein
MLNTMPIYTIGDSHSRLSFEYDFNVQTRHPRIKNSFWLGPITMYRVGRDSISFSKHSVPNNGIVVSCFGEIDVRNHIYKHVNLGRDEDDIIEELVSNYMKALVHNRQNGYTHIAVMNIVPVIEYQFDINTPHIRKPTLESGNPEFPFLGTHSDRQRYTLKINKSLQTHCISNNFGYLDIYTKHINDQGFLKVDYSDGNCHLRCKLFLDELLDDMLKSFCPTAE